MNWHTFWNKNLTSGNSPAPAGSTSYEMPRSGSSSSALLPLRPDNKITERNKYPLFDGFSCSTREYFASCVEFFRWSPQEENQQQKYKPFFLLFFDFLVEAYFLSSAIPNRQHVSSKWRQKKRKFTLKLNKGDVGKIKTLSLMDGDHFLLNHLCD